ncbi:MAG: hypothetical protein ACRD1T_09635, partial [Acidimicrobiia bacterium]
MSVETEAKPRTLRTALVLSAAAFIAYNVNLRYMVGGDEWPHRLLPLAILLDGTLSLHEVIRFYSVELALTHPSLPYWAVSVLGNTGHETLEVGQRILSAYPPATAILAIPFYLPVLFMGSQIPLLLFAKLAASSMVAASAAFLYAALMRLGTKKGWAITISLGYALATPVFAGASQNLSQHSSGVLAVALFVYCAVRVYKGEARWALGAALAGALVFAVRPLLVFLVAPLALLVFLRAGRYRFLTVGIAIVGVGAQLLFNLAAYGRIFGGYSIAVERFAELGLPTPAFGNPLEGILGLLISPGRGLFVFAPITLVAIPGAIRAVRERGWFLIACAAGALAHLVFFSSYKVWWGGYAYGPRYLIEAMPMVALLAQPLAVSVSGLDLRPGRILVRLALLVSLGVQLLGAFNYPCSWDSLPE